MKDSRGDINVSFPVGGRLSDPRFDLSDAIWTALRTVAVKTITLPVSWIGRVQLSSDSRIERIQIDPIRFQPGTATLTAEGQEQVGRLSAFLGEVSGVRMMLTPVVSSRDRVARGGGALEAAIDRVAREGQFSREDAARRLFERRFPDRPPPATVDAALAALVEGDTKVGDEMAELGAQRVDAVRTAIKRAGADSRRLLEGTRVERGDAESQVELAILEPDIPRRSPIRDVLRRLGVPFTGADGAKE